MNTGGLSIGALALDIVLVGIEVLLTVVGLNGAGPVLKDGFLCVCMSDVTFFKPINKNHVSYKLKKTFHA